MPVTIDTVTAAADPTSSSCIPSSPTTNLAPRGRVFSLLVHTAKPSSLGKRHSLIDLSKLVDRALIAEENPQKAKAVDVQEVEQKDTEEVAAPLLTVPLSDYLNYVRTLSVQYHEDCIVTFHQPRASPLANEMIPRARPKYRSDQVVVKCTKEVFLTDDSYSPATRLDACTSPVDENFGREDWSDLTTALASAWGTPPTPPELTGEGGQRQRCTSANTRTVRRVSSYQEGSVYYTHFTGTGLLPSPE
ncbi:hypothetical protein FRB99_000664 [Tulasnella sp. 403]|nr:hypothetical protein FRB99_000664 [Tulasnella sp. 403]